MLSPLSPMNLDSESLYSVILSTSLTFTGRETYIYKHHYPVNLLFPALIPVFLDTRFCAMQTYCKYVLIYSAYWCPEQSGSIAIKCTFCKFFLTVYGVMWNLILSPFSVLSFLLVAYSSALNPFFQLL